MRKTLLRTWPFRLTAHALTFAMVVGSMPVYAAAPAPAQPSSTSAAEPAPTVDPAPAPGATPEPEPVLTPKSVVVNRTLPKVKAHALMPRFSPIPTVEEIQAARVFSEPLVPLGGKAADAENKDLAGALRGFLARSGGANTGGVEAYLSKHPGSPWAASVLANLGSVYKSTGAFSKAIATWRRAWDLAKNETDLTGRAVADRAVGELCVVLNQLGQEADLQTLLDEIGDRNVRGSAGTKVSQMRKGLAVLKDNYALATPSGPLALDRILRWGHPDRLTPEAIRSFPGTHHGATLTQIAELAAGAGMELQMAYRESGEVPVPSVVHLKLNHYLAVVDRAGDDYILDDPVQGGPIRVSQATLLDESSGYFLVPSLPAGWRAVSADEGGTIRGKCTAPQFESAGPTACSATTAGSSSNSSSSSSSSSSSCSWGRCMAVYTTDKLYATLRIEDEPVGYTPPLGPAVQFHLIYHHAEQNQPQIFAFSNTGPKWTHSWQSYVEDNPNDLTQSAIVHLSGAGIENYSGFNAATNSYLPDFKSHATLVRTATSPIRYERRLADGSVETFSQADSAQAYPRRIFMTSRSDPQGNAITFTYDSYNGNLRLVAVSDALPPPHQVTTLSYEHPSDPLKITKVTDPFGRYATLEYNADGQLSKITDVIGIVSQFAYEADEFITTLTTPYGTSSFDYDHGMVNHISWVDLTDPLGAKERVLAAYGNAYGTSYSYPTTEPVAPVGVSVYNADLAGYNTFYWDKRAWMLYPGDYLKADVTHWLGGVGSYVMPVVSSVKKPLENRVWYTYQGQASPPTRIGVFPEPAAIARVLDDGTSQIYRYEYNSLGKVTRQTDPLGRTTINNYAANGIDLLEKRQVNGQTTELLRGFTYNAQHQPLTVTDTAGQTTTYTYNTQGQLLTAVTPPRAGITENRTTTYSYDTNGYLQSVAGPATGAATSYTYDGYGRPRTVTDSEGYLLTADYDSLDRPTKVTYPDGTYEQAVYDRLDAQDRRDRLGRWSHTFYDALRRPVSMRDPANRAITQQWCSCGSLDKIIDATGNTTSWGRDLQGRVTSETRADNAQWAYVYENTTSRVHTRTDAKGQVVTYTYTLDDNPSQTVYTNATIPTPTVSFTYDPTYNRVSSMTDGTGTTNYTYFPVTATPSLGAGKLQAVDGPLTSDTVTYSYDELGRVTTRGLSAFSRTSAYDALGRIASLTSPAGTFNWTYVNTTGRPQTVTYPNGQLTTYSYFNNAGDQRLQEIKHQQTSGGAVLSQFDYTYDPVGNISTWQQQLGATGAKVYGLGYDAADQLSSAVQRDVSTQQVLKNYGYAFDLAGNKTVDAQDSTATTSQYNNRNQLTQQTGGAKLPVAGALSEAATVAVSGTPASVNAANQFAGTTQAGTGTQNFTVVATDPSGNTRTNTYQVNVSGTAETLVYDANGNLCAKGGTTCANGATTYEWDAENRLTAVKQDGNTLASFTYDGQGRRATKMAAGVTTTYVHDRDNITEERLSTGQTLDYVQGAGIDRPLAQRDQAGVVSYYLSDHLGSIVQTTSSAGAVSLTREYDPWGNLLAGASASGYAFTGREWDPEAGLYYYRARYYDPKIGRFWSEDPIGFRGGVNTYSYVGNSPTTWTDPSGLAPNDPPPPSINGGKPWTFHPNPRDSRGGFWQDEGGNQASWDARWRHWDVDPPGPTGQAGAGPRARYGAWGNLLPPSAQHKAAGGPRQPLRLPGFKGIAGCLAVVAAISTIVQALQYAEEMERCRQNPCDYGCFALGFDCIP